MIRRRAVALAAGLVIALAPPARTAAQTPAETASAAVAAFQDAIRDLDAAQSARDRVAALTRTIGAYEAGLGILREALRLARLRETELVQRLEARQTRVGQLLGVLAQLEAQPGPLLLLHPSGPLGTVRSGMLLSEVTPSLQAEVDTLSRELTELRDLRNLQAAAAAHLTDGLTRVQAARTALSQAISDRTALPPRFSENAGAMQALIEGAETLDALAHALPPHTGGNVADAGFAARAGTLELPVRGTLLRRMDEADAAGVRRPGITLSTRPQALVTAPASGTIRFVGPMAAYGNVMILEPGGDFLLVLAGFGTVFGPIGAVVAEGDPLGLMPGADPGAQDFASIDGTGARETETLYIEVRRGARPEDPAPWFAALGEQDRP